MSGKGTAVQAPPQDAPEKLEKNTPQNESRKNVAARHASSVAFASKKAAATRAKTASDFVKYTRSMLQFQLLNIQNQLSFLDNLSEMSDEEKLQTLFDVLDEDGNNQIDARELAEGLRKIDPDTPFADNLMNAVDALATYDTDDDAKLDIDEFKSFLDSLVNEANCTFQEFAELLVLTVIFSETEENPIEDQSGVPVFEDLNEAAKEQKGAHDALCDARMLSLFKLFDVNGDGSVDTKELAIGLYKIFEDLDENAKIAVEALIMYDEGNERSLNYEQFAELILKIVASAPNNLKFDDVADTMLMMACKPMELTEEDLSFLRVTEEMHDVARDLEKEGVDIDALQYGKLQRLFDLFDLDDDEFIDLSELVLMLGKFQDSREIEETVTEAVVTMLSFDANKDQRLDRLEYSRLLAEFAKESRTDLYELIDFVAVVTALKGNDEIERTYLNSINMDAVEQLKALESELNLAYE